MELESVLDNEELLWKQNSRIDWLFLGDRNTSYFHRQASRRRNFNHIKSLKLANGLWCYDEVLIKNEFLYFFRKLYNGLVLDRYPIPNRFHRLGSE